MAEDKSKRIACGHTWVQEVKGIWHKKHLCKLYETKDKPHTGFHVCSCGEVD